MTLGSNVARTKYFWVSRFVAAVFACAVAFGLSCAVSTQSAWADDYEAQEGSSDNPTEAQDNANSWRFSNGERIEANGTAEGEDAVATYARSIEARGAVAGVDGVYATWTSGNGANTYTWRANPTDANTYITVPGAKEVGIDVSQWNGAINWSKVKADGITFAIIRCGYGSNFESQDDTTFLTNVKGAQAAGIKIGVYLYSYATKTTGADSSGQSEAEHVLRLLDEAGLEPADLALPVYLDMEDSSTLGVGNAQLGNIAKIFCDTVSGEGYEVGIYANTNWWRNYLTASCFSNSSWHKWVASWPGASQATSSGVSGTEVWQFSNCGDVNGINGNVDMNFSYVNWGTGGWKKVGSTWYYLNSDGTAKTGWLYTGGAWYYLDPSKDGAMATGWVKVSGTWYYCNGSGSMQTGWLKLGGTWYYLNSSGAMATGWKSVGGTWYYLNPGNGAMQTGWIDDNGTWYYANGSGAMQTGWLSTGGKWYYLKGSGAMATGWASVGGAWYYLTPGNGAMRTGWVLDGSTWYYCNGSGAMLTGWQWIGGSWYYLKASGAMATGWESVGGAWYYLGSSGAMQTGWEKVGGTWYYLNGSGVMQTGWLKLGGTWYYLNGSGAMLTGMHTINGVRYSFSSSGAWIG